MHIAGNNDAVKHPGVLGTGIAKLPGTGMSRVGLTEKAAREEGYAVETIVAGADDKAHYYPGSSKMLTKMICDRNTHKLLGIQCVGKGAVDKMADIAVVAISMGATPGGPAKLRLCLHPALFHRDPSLRRHCERSAQQALR